MKKILLTIALVAVSAFAISAPKTHDGFFLNATMGLGYSSFNDDIDKGAGKMTCNGGAFIGSFKLGGAIIPNIILHATFSGSSIFSELKLKSSYVEQKLEHDGFNMLMLGAGLTYYIYPEENVYASASFGITDVSISFNNQDYEFDNLDAGFGFNITIGKEWWMNDELGLGIAFSYEHHSADGEYHGEKNEASSNSFSLVATLTFN
jgi:hypothetical protein